MAITETETTEPRCAVCGTGHNVDQYRIDVFKVLSDEEVFIRQLNLCAEHYERAKRFIIQGLSPPLPHAPTEPTHN